MAQGWRGRPTRQVVGPAGGAPQQGQRQQQQQHGSVLLGSGEDSREPIPAWPGPTPRPIPGASTVPGGRVSWSLVLVLCPLYALVPVAPVQKEGPGAPGAGRKDGSGALPR